MAPALAQEVAEPLAIEFSWNAPESCPSREQVLEQLNKAVDAGGKQLPALSAQAVVQQHGTVWHLDLTTEMDGRRGMRELEADSCDGLARAATLVLALTLGEGIARRQQAEAEARAAAPEPKPEPAEPPPPPASPAEKEGPLQSYLWAAATVGTDALGQFGSGAALGFVVQPAGALQLGLRIDATLPRSSGFDTSSSEIRSFSLGGTLQGCLASALPPVLLAGCLDVGMTALRAQGKGSARNDSVWIPLYGAGPSVTARWLLGERAFVGVSFLSRFFLWRPDLVVEGLNEQRRVEAASLAAELGAGVRW